MRPPAGELGR
jgi:hypothetical protein